MCEQKHIYTSTARDNWILMRARKMNSPKAVALTDITN